MKILIADDDINSRVILTSILAPYGACHEVDNGMEAVSAFCAALDQNEPFQLVCMDIMMPEMDGHEAVQAIRAEEKSRQISAHDEAVVIMTTALDTLDSIIRSFDQGGCNAYLGKPIRRAALLEKVRNYGLISEFAS
ncbi:MAG: response regulator [Magnetococcales bacterium]|nr:response regulator [Magnetococcales bacterium]NGZ06788.1 response regulator [Magnetococcales bacterium]